MPNNTDNRLIALGYNVASHSSAMLAYWDKDLICRFANDAYLEWFGISPDEMIDKISLKTVLGALYEQNLLHIKAALAGKMQIFERLILTPSGITKIARATYIPDIIDGEVNGFYVQVADVSPLNNHNTGVDTNIAEKVPGPVYFTDRLLGEVVQTLQSCILTEFPGIGKLAKKHFISESKLKRDFKEKYDTTIFSYYRGLQMELAEKYLAEKRCNKNQMAILLNFSNPSNFSACYKKYLKEKSTRELIAHIEKEHDERYQTFIEQAPVEIAMLDNNLVYLAASRRWIEVHRLQNTDFIGKSILDISPVIKLKFRNILADCLRGHTSKCDEAYIERLDGSHLWLRWEVKPWYKRNKSVGGLLMYTEDITALKLKEEEARLFSLILEKTSEISRIGAWQLNFRTDTAIWSKVVKEILEVPDDFNPPELDDALKFFKEGASRGLIQSKLLDAIENKEPFDVVAEMITAKGRQIRGRVIGYPDFIDLKCEKISGILHEITDKELNLENE
ncbi:PAS domain-containing protein [Mucilaginibacter gotjawali]|uniref:PAS domain S-box-containing protein n=2 Tax=Mucilaginibacter gotjawali TaxID=1550579 RepID=A0A839SGG1_9SPHI|nr:PAS domain-containing protein [Mucilaginibacter gotjawali]MBB3056364.1 PAS domain S-box-containing protein [Mucilaginibacter gotjawali]BAU55069.1 PAS fold protein [Mucilaginibacter gotjawali]